MERTREEAREQLELIARMIDQTRSRLIRNAGRPFLIWGYATLATTAAVAAALCTTGDRRWNVLWFAIPLIGWIGMYLTRGSRQQEASTYVDRVLRQIWIVLGTAVWVGLTPVWLGAAAGFPVLTIVLLLMGIGTAISGLVIRFPLLAAGGFVAIGLAPCLTLASGCAQLLLFGIGFALMMILPGHLLNYRSNHPAPKERHGKE